MRTSRLLSLVGISMLALACDRAPTQVQAPVPTPRAAVVLNAWWGFSADTATCQGDPIHIEGKYHLVRDSQLIAHGTYRLIEQTNVEGTGLDAQGNVYNFHYNALYRPTDPPGPASSLHYEDFFRLIGRGPAANTKFYFEVRRVIDDDGNWIVDVYHIRPECH